MCQQQRQRQQHVLDPLLRSHHFDRGHQPRASLAEHSQRLADRAHRRQQSGVWSYDIDFGSLPPDRQIGPVVADITKRLKAVGATILFDCSEFVGALQIQRAVGRQDRIKQPQMVGHLPSPAPSRGRRQDHRPALLTYQRDELQHVGIVGECRWIGSDPFGQSPLQRRTALSRPARQFHSNVGTFGCQHQRLGKHVGGDQRAVQIDEQWNDGRGRR